MSFKAFIKRVGVYLKHILYVIKLKRIRKERALKRSIEKILIVMNAGIGNSIEATPFIQALRALLPYANITIYSPIKDIFDGWCVVDEITKSPKEIDGKAYDQTFICGGHFPYESGISCKLGKMHTVKHLFGAYYLKPEREYHMDMVRRMGYKGPTPPLYVSMSKPEKKIPESPLLIGIIPGGVKTETWKHKRWPYYIQLIKTILKKYPKAHICIIGSQEDDLPGEVPRSQNITDLRGHLSLSQTAWVLKYLNIAIGNDCGPMHIADAVRLPSVVIFGPTCELKNRYIYGIPLYLEVNCRPCQYSELIKTCKSPRCMTELTADMAMKEIDMLLDFKG